MQAASAGANIGEAAAQIDPQQPEETPADQTPTTIGEESLATTTGGTVAVGLIGMVSASVASWFVARRREAEAAAGSPVDVAALQGQLEVLAAEAMRRRRRP